MMAVRKLITSLILFGAGSLFIVLLYFLSERINQSPNGFIRLFPPHKINPTKIIDIKFNTYYICGANSKYVYLGNYKVFSQVLAYDHRTFDTQTIRLSVPNGIKIFKSAHVAINDENVFVMDGIAPGILSAKLPDTYLGGRIRSPNYTACVPLSISSFIFRSVDTSRQNVLIKQSGDSIRHVPGILQKQVDGIFCTDGVLMYEPIHHRIVYAYYHRNEFVCLDTNLNIIYRGRTIDTTSRVKFKIAEGKGNGEMSISSPSMPLNKHVSVNEDWIFVNSGLLANNERTKSFKKCSVIDVYALKDGKYNFSFYLPDHESKKITDFKVFGKTLIALFDHYLYTWELNF